MARARIVSWKPQEQVMLRVLGVLTAVDPTVVTMVRARGNYMSRLSSHNSHMSDACSRTILVSALGTENFRACEIVRSTASRSGMRKTLKTTVILNIVMICRP
jgi:hypothetical protein